MIALIQTGGTIASVGKPLRPLDAARFRALWEANLEGAPELDWKATARPLDSSAAGPADWGAIARLVLQAADDSAVGAVCLHGTDTLAFTAAALAMLTTEIDDRGAPVARLGLPLVLTGSMRPLFEGDGLAKGTDATANLEHALELAGSGVPGTRVAFGGWELPGARVMKLHTSEDAAFGAPNGPGPALDLPEAPPRTIRRQLERLIPHLDRRAVLTVTVHPGKPAHHRAALAGAIKAVGPALGAIHLLAFGDGTVPGEEALAPVLTQAAARGILVAVGTQVPGGAVDPGTYAAGAWLRRTGAVGTGDMTSAATNAKLHIALALAAARGWNRDAALRFFSTPVAAERTV